MSIFPAVKLRIGATYSAFVATPFKLEPVALITILDAGCDFAPA